MARMADSICGCVAWAALLGALLAAPGCGGDTAAPSKPTTGAAKPAAFDPSAATATIAVRAVLKGAPPVLRPIAMSGDKDCAALHGTTKVLEDSVVLAGDRLANVIAWVSKGAERWTYATPTTAVLLDQKGCMYQPHVFTLMVNQPLTIRTSDALTHNIHSAPKVNDEFNHSQLKGAADMTEKFAKEEVGLRIKCDIHNWMQSWAGVFSHPFHGVTGADGTVSIKVPPGEYEVSVWHEYAKFAKPAPQSVKVAAGETKEIEFVYEAAK
jgi:hypothetical protein